MAERRHANAGTGTPSFLQISTKPRSDKRLIGAQRTVPAVCRARPIQFLGSLELSSEEMHHALRRLPKSCLCFATAAGRWFADRS